MNNQIVKIQVEPEDFLPEEIDVLLSLPLLIKFNLNPKQPIRFSYGNETALVKFQSTSQTFPFIRVKESLSHQLSLPDSFFEICCTFCPEEQTLRIGPLIGILASYNEEEKTQPFKDLTIFFQEILQAAKEKHGMAYVFTLDQIDKEGPIQGWIHKNGEWMKKNFPFPNCVYNRISSRKVERNAETREKIYRLKEKGIPFFNDKFLDKWSIYKGLILDPDLSQLLPYTAQYHEPESLQFFLQKHPYIYAKPIHGSLGNGIISIQRTKDYACHLTSINGTISYHFPTFSKLMQKIQPQLKKRSYLLQEGLHLLTCNGNILDFRALVQKNKVGEWSITSIVARISKDNKIVSNVARGGSIFPLTEALISADVPLPIEETRSAIRKSALRVANAMDLYIQGEFAELGIDLALDVNGKVWLIEVNSKPSKNDASLSRGSQIKKVRRSVVKLMDYCYFRSGFIQSPHNSSRRRSKKK